MKTKFESLTDSKFEKLSDEVKGNVKGGGPTYMSIWTYTGGGGGGSTIATTDSLVVGEESVSAARLDTVYTDDSPSGPILV